MQQCEQSKEKVRTCTEQERAQAIVDLENLDKKIKSKYEVYQSNVLLTSKKAHELYEKSVLGYEKWQEMDEESLERNALKVV